MGEVCPACSAPLQLVWVHGHGQCANCATPIVACCMGAGQEADEHAAAATTLDVDDVLHAFAAGSGGHDTMTLQSLVLLLAQRHDCSQDAAAAAVARAAALHRLFVQGTLVRRHA